MPEKELIIRLSVFDKKEDLRIEHGEIESKFGLGFVKLVVSEGVLFGFFKKKKKVLNFLKFILQLGKPHPDPGTFKQSSVSM